MKKLASLIGAVFFFGVVAHATTFGSVRGVVHDPQHRPIQGASVTPNVGDKRVQLDNSLTFGSFHWNNPRQIYVEFRYRIGY